MRPLMPLPGVEPLDETPVFLPTTGSFASRNFIYSCCVFVLLGVVTTMLGSLLPVLSRHWRLTAAMAGGLFSWQFCGATLGTLLSAKLRQKHFKHLEYIGLLLCICGVFSLGYLSWPWLRLSVACFGVGLGFAIPAINLTVSANSNARAASLAVLNACWTIGAILGPLAMQLFFEIKTFLLNLAILIAVALLVGVNLDTDEVGGHKNQPARKRGAAGTAVAAFAALFFLYVGMENAIAGWIASYALPIVHSEHRSMTASAVFWGTFLCARLLAPLLPSESLSGRIFFIAGVVAVLGMSALLFSRENTLLILGICLSGFGLGCIYPILIAAMVEVIGAENPAATVCFAFSGLGAAMFPLAAGWLGQATGRANNGIALSLSAMCLIFFLYSGVSRLVRAPLSRAAMS